MLYRLKNVIYFPSMNIVGGVETYCYEMAVKYGKDYDITVLYQNGDPQQMMKIAKVCRTIRITNADKIECDVFIFGWGWDILENVTAKRYLQTFHADYINRHLNPSPSPKITDRFGDSGTLIVLFENCEDAEEKEKLLLSLVESYRKADGTGVLKSSVAYSTTVGQVFDVDKAAADFGISKEDATLLFTIYRFTEDGSAVKMNLRTFCEFAVELIENDADALEYVNPETAKMLSSLMSLDEMLSGEYTASELHEAISDIALLDGLSIDSRIVDLVYGNMLWDEIPDQRARVVDLLAFLSTYFSCLRIHVSLLLVIIS